MKSKHFLPSLSNPINFDIFPIIITLILNTRLRRLETLILGLEIFTLLMLVLI